MTHKQGLFLSLFFIFSAFTSYAQPYVEGGNTRHRFAQMTVGAELTYRPSGGNGRFIENGQTQDFAFPDRLQPRLSIGGTHFWGHCEFYVSFPLGNLLSEAISENSEIASSSGIETALKIYPWRLERKKVRPFLGSGMSVPNWRLTQEEGRGAYLSKTIVPLMGGLTYQRGNLLYELGGRYRLGRDQAYYLDRSQSTIFQQPRFSLFAGVRWQLETTLSAEEPYLDGRTDAVVEYLKKNKKLSAFSLAVGPSSTFFLLPERSTYNDAERPYLSEHKGSNVFPEFGLGYYHYPSDAHLNLSYRSYASFISAYGYQQRIARRAFTLEAYKFLFDYHGFVPFIGPFISWDRWSLRESDQGTLVNDQTKQHVLPGLTFGWDIRPNDAQWFILRTNLRYNPSIFQTSDDTQLFLHHLEFNFIQLVIYPGRWRAFRGK